MQVFLDAAAWLVIVISIFNMSVVSFLGKLAIKGDVERMIRWKQKSGKRYKVFLRYFSLMLIAIFWLVWGEV